VSSGASIAVTVAATLLAITLGVHFTLSVWTQSPAARSHRLVAALLTLQAGGALVLGTIATTAAARSWQLIDRPVDAPAGPNLFTVSRIDGNGSMFALIVLAVVAAAALSAVVLLLAARFVVGHDPAERWIACIVLGLEIGLCGYGLSAALGGSHSAPALLAVVNLPLAVAGMVVAWPPARPESAWRGPGAA
jgi:hypothetical protein